MCYINVMKSTVKFRKILDYIKKISVLLNPICLLRKNSSTLVFHAGIQRSGTNFLREIIENGFCINILNKIDPMPNSFNHKHFRIFDKKEFIIMDVKYHNDIQINCYSDYEKLLGVKNIKILVIYKDPINWLLSIKRWAIKCKWIDSENFFDDVMMDYLKEYDLYYSKWKELSLSSSGRIKLFQYEVLIDKPDKGYSEIGNFLECNPIRIWNPSYVSHTGDFKKKPVPENFRTKKFIGKIYGAIKFDPDLRVYE